MREEKTRAIENIFVMFLHSSCRNGQKRDKKTAGRKNPLNFFVRKKEEKKRGGEKRRRKEEKKRGGVYALIKAHCGRDVRVGTGAVPSAVRT
jgi:hypothetical protein